MLFERTGCVSEVTMEGCISLWTVYILSEFCNYDHEALEFIVSYMLCCIFNADRLLVLA